MAGNPEQPISVAWARWRAAPFLVMTVVFAGKALDHQENLWVLLWFALATLSGYVALSMLLDRTVVDVDDQFPGTRTKFKRTGFNANGK
jgi:hypothetical protein